MKQYQVCLEGAFWGGGGGVWILRLQLPTAQKGGRTLVLLTIWLSVLGTVEHLHILCGGSSIASAAPRSCSSIGRAHRAPTPLPCPSEVLWKRGTQTTLQTLIN